MEAVREGSKGIVRCKMADQACTRLFLLLLLYRVSRNVHFDSPCCDILAHKCGQARIALIIGWASHSSSSSPEHPRSLSTNPPRFLLTILRSTSIGSRRTFHSQVTSTFTVSQHYHIPPPLIFPLLLFHPSPSHPKGAHGEPPTTPTAQTLTSSRHIVLLPPCTVQPPPRDRIRP